MEKYRHIFEKEVEKPKSFDLKGFFKDKVPSMLENILHLSVSE